jgi:hypothetical protein
VDDLIFKAKKHEYYTKDGKKIPSVSEMISCLSNLVYGDVDEFVLQRAAEKGTEIHELTLELDTMGEVYVPGELSGYVQAYAQFLKDHDVKWVMAETAMKDNDDRFAGTIDRYGVVDGIPTLLDIKTSSKITGKNMTVYEAQMNFYRSMVEGHIKYPVNQMFVLHLKSDGSYSLEDVDMNYDLVTCCLIINEKMKRRKKRSKNGRSAVGKTERSV